MTDETTVYVGTVHKTGDRVYHTDRSCSHLPAKLREKRQEALDELGWSHCSFCAGEVDRSGDGDRRRSLLNWLRAQDGGGD